MSACSKGHGLLVFSYHHSRTEGWRSLADAVIGAGFSIVNAHPVKAELSLGVPKSQARQPIQLDVILVCRKQEKDGRTPLAPTQAARCACIGAEAKLNRLAATGLQMLENDRRIVVFSQFLAALGPVTSAEAAVAALDSRGNLDQFAISFIPHDDARMAPDANSIFPFFPSWISTQVPPITLCS